MRPALTSLPSRQVTSPKVMNYTFMKVCPPPPNYLLSTIAVYLVYATYKSIIMECTEFDLSIEQHNEVTVNLYNIEQHTCILYFL